MKKLVTKSLPEHHLMTTDCNNNTHAHIMRSNVASKNVVLANVTMRVVPLIKKV